MQKINFQNLPSTTTPINATNLNAIQSNVENVFNGSETMGNIVVGSIETKNMFDGIMVNGTIETTTGNIDSTYSDYSIASVNLIPVKPNTTYTISFSGGNYVIDRIATFNSSGAFISRSNSLNVRTFTTDANTYYIRFNIWSSGITPSSIGNTQLEKGSTATSYTPHQELNNHEYYTIGEQPIGTWIDGSNVYRKVITYTNSSPIGASGSVTNISIPHSTPNLSLLINAKLVKGGYNFPTLSGGASVNSSTSITQVTSTTINLRIINDTWGASTWYIVIEYVK